MEGNRVAVVAIIIENADATERINDLLHDYAQYICGRMGLPMKEKKLSVITLVIDAPQNAISTLSGKLGRLSGVTSKVIYSPEKA